MTAHRRLGAFAMLALALVTGAARADRLDSKLNAETPRIIESLQKQGIKNIGVLRFRVQQGNRPASFSTGAINGNLATRLENALILHAGSDDREILTVINDAGTEAAQRKVGNWFNNTEQQKKLFDVTTYPVAWGSRRTKADAFLTGVVRVPADYSKCTVSVELIRAPGKVEKVHDFAFEPDTSLLHDLGKSYSLSRRSLGTGVKSEAAVRKRAFEAVRRRDAEEPNPGGGTPPGGGGENPGNDQPNIPPGQTSVEAGGVKFEMVVAGNPVEIKQSSSGDAKMGVESPDQGQPISFRITNTTDRTLGVDLRLNGLSLLFEQPTPPEASRVFVLQPGKMYDLKGFFLDEGESGTKNVTPFKVLIGDEARAMRDQLGDRAGEIQINVFEQGTPADEIEISLRGPKKPDKNARGKLSSLQNAIMRGGLLKKVVREEKVNNRIVKRELIVKDDAEEARQLQKLKAVDFQRNPAPVGAVVLQVIPKGSPETGGPKQ